MGGGAEEAGLPGEGAEEAGVAGAGKGIHRIRGLMGQSLVSGIRDHRGNEDLGCGGGR